MKKSKSLTKKRTETDKQKLIEQLKKTPIVQVACEKTEIGRATFYRWYNSDPEFAKSADEALAEGLLLVNDLAESQLISAIKERDMKGIIFWLRNHHPQYATKLEIHGKIEVDEKLSPEQEAVVREALRLASAQPEEINNLNQQDNATKQQDNSAGTSGSNDTGQASQSINN